MRPYEALPIPISLASGETNEAFRTLTGSSETWQESLHPDDRAGIEVAVAQARSSRQRVQFEARLRGRDGAWLTMSANGVAIDDGKDEGKEYGKEEGTYVLTWREAAVDGEDAARFVAFKTEHERALEDR